MTGVRRAWVLAAAAAAAGCHESTFSVELTEKGTATFAGSSKLSTVFVNGGTRLARLSPKLAILKDADPLFLRVPEYAEKKELEKAGLRILEQSSTRTDEVMVSAFRLQLQRLSALEALPRLCGTAAGDEVPKETGLHLPVDAVRLSRDAEGVYALEGTFPVRATVAIQAGSVKDEGDVLARSLSVGMSLANEVNNFRLTIVMAVPGDIVDFSPSDAGKVETGKDGAPKKDARKVTFTPTMASLGPGYVGRLKGEYVPLEFRVRFRMKKGRSLPDDALWDGKPRAPAASDPPPAPPPPK